MDITDTFEAKVRAMEAYKSQHQAVFGIRDQLEPKARAYAAIWLPFTQQNQWPGH